MLATQSFFVLLIVVLMVLVAACGGDDSIQYPGAPVISIKKVSWDGMSLRYHLEAKQPLPYDLLVELGIGGEGEGGEQIEGIRYSHSHLGDETRHSHTDDIVHYQMQKGRSLLGNELHDSQIRYYQDPDIDRWWDTQVWGPPLKTLTLQILPWNGLGDAPYNVGSPSKLIVTGE